MLIGGILTFAALFIVFIIFMSYSHNENNTDEIVQIKYLERPVAYENKQYVSFKVFKIMGNAVLAREISDDPHKFYYGNNVLILGKDYYNDQVITVKNPMRVGSYNYSKGMFDSSTIVPVIDGEISY